MDDPRIPELLADLLIEMRGVTNILNTHTGELQQLRKEQNRTNLAIGELRLSVMRLADELKAIHDHEQRIDKLERVVFK